MTVLQSRRPRRIATQAEEAAAVSTTTDVTPANQQFHPSAAKCWAYVTVAAGTPTLVASYNITSITDTGVGILTITIATDFASANWASFGTIELAGSTVSCVVSGGTKAAGSIALLAINVAGSAADPASWNFAGFGVQ